MGYKTLRLVLGDQLDSQHSWFSQQDNDVLYLIAELKQESEYVTHHIQKQVAFFLSMESFAQSLMQQGHHVHYLTLDDTCAFDSLSELIASVGEQYNIVRFEYQRPDEYRLLDQLSHFSHPQFSATLVESEHFLLPFSELETYFVGGKALVMDHFYRKMRKKHGVLMESETKPLGGKWSYDANNRNKLKKSDIKALPTPLLFASPTKETVSRIERHNLNSIGRIEEQLIWPINRSQSLTLLAHFCQVCLPNFGRFQDAMTEQHESQWSLYHSRLSFSLNCKMLSPLEVLYAAIEQYAHTEGKITLAQIEGFVRQILGWREYIRGMYWSNMPDYSTTNVLKASRALPQYFWNGETKMSCMKRAITQSLDFAYAHHIQRLMVTGNFALLTELDPDQVEQWYLGIYVDAIEWVEMPNTRGMALYADGGLIATKPYGSSGGYINKMSDYCSGCFYNVKERSGQQACPFNGFYWRFMHKHRDWLSKNPRTAMIYRTWDRLAPDVQDEHLTTAEANLARIERL
ncbi:cryptochrome/photolyase family protein [Vibrio mediterranei]|uniref:Cryptochrome/photolyase family protein n=1 Tax=Vibrio mediterranei TaxID=689 RepID=A0ABX5DDV4_9VIBR|nr:cryptochrome/photolyase family protein [Vibrio mediterranei]PCD87226.1 cryptochrome/photolyase family protein [Vibrio mediterranei]PRQ66811.1 cryptochrome/photolyase family protein [Vibrio mediterranei]